MSLNISKIIEDINELAKHLIHSINENDNKIYKAKNTLEKTNPLTLIEQLQKLSPGFDFPSPAEFIDTISENIPAKPLPEDFRVIGIDGSHIDIDRHIAIDCYLINIGGCILVYGQTPEAKLFSKPKLYSDYEELHIINPLIKTHEIPVTGEVLSLTRDIQEVESLANTIEENNSSLPTIAFLDGTLIKWSFPSTGSDFLRDYFIKKGIVKSLDKIENIASKNPLGVVSYISKPRATDIVNLLRISNNYCSFLTTDCRSNCSTFEHTKRPCSDLNNILDRDVFSLTLKPLHRSSLFKSSSTIVKNYYQTHQIFFYYVNTGNEIARIELPEWAAMNKDILELSHSIVLQQSEKGLGYPVCISEAHEQAILTMSDRKEFEKIIERTIQQYNLLGSGSSEKSKSKRIKAI